MAEPGQIGYGGCHEQLEEGLSPAEVAGFSRTKLHQPGNAMFCHLPKRAIGRVRPTTLKRSGLLKQSFLRMQGHASPFPRTRCHAIGAQPTGSAEGRIKSEGKSGLSGAMSILTMTYPHQLGRLPSCRAAARVPLQIDGEVLFRKVPPVGSPGYPGDQLPACIGKSKMRRSR